MGNTRFENFVIVCVVVSAILLGNALAGPTNLKDEVKVAEYQADKAFKADPDYLSEAAFQTELAAANNIAKLQALLLKQSKSKKAKDKYDNEAKEKVKATKGAKK
jgi:hypothetical protein